MTARDTLWFDQGRVLTASGRVLDRCESVDEAARAYPWPIVLRLGQPQG